MELEALVRESWQRHAEEPEAVLNRLRDGLRLVSEPAQLTPLAGLIVHVAGEHLGRWDEGIGMLEELCASEAAEAGSEGLRACWRSLAVLNHCAGRLARRDACLDQARDPAWPPASSELRVLAVAASALAANGRYEEAEADFARAVELASYGPGTDDPAARALAVTGNNLACDLEGRPERSKAESRLLRQASTIARRFWEIAGTWLNVERAEYRLAMTHLALGEASRAQHHAEAALALCEANSAEAAEHLFASEALARACHARGDAAGAAAARTRAEGWLDSVEDEDLRRACEAELQSLREHLEEPPS